MPTIFCSMDDCDNWNEDGTCKAEEVEVNEQVCFTYVSYLDTGKD